MLSLSSTHFRNIVFLCVGGRGLDDICISFRRLLDCAFNGFVFVLEAGCGGLNFVKLTCHFRVVLCDFGLDIFVLLFEARDACLNVLKGVEHYVFFVGVTYFDPLSCFLNRCSYCCERGSLYRDSHRICFARLVV